MRELTITIIKRCIFLLISVLFISSLANAQYRINKKKYDYRTYSYQVGDPYNPSSAAAASAIIPGLGQMRSGECGRGVAFLVGTTGCGLSFGLGVIFLISNCLDDVKSNFGIKSMTIGGGIGFLAFHFWSIEDAFRVAKVNNLAWRDQKKRSYNFQIQPNINPTYYTQNASIPIGLTLKVKF